MLNFHLGDLLLPISTYPFLSSITHLQLSNIPHALAISFPPLNHFTNLHSLELSDVPFPYVVPGTTTPVKHIHIHNSFQSEEIDWVAILVGALELCSLRIDCRYSGHPEHQGGDMANLLLGRPLSPHLSSLSFYYYCQHWGRLLQNLLQFYSSSLTHVGIQFSQSYTPSHVEYQALWNKVYSQCLGIDGYILKHFLFFS
jgi:hypothetical protein